MLSSPTSRPNGKKRKMAMITNPFAQEIDRQLPIREEIFLDHIGHFVRDPKAANRGLLRVGFSPTPASIQVNPDPSRGESPTGTGNITAMFHRGYIEVLFKTANTPLGLELDRATSRYPGVHLAAFSVSDAAAAHRRLEASGFRVRPLTQMERPVVTEVGSDIAAFTIARVELGEMAEGRIQILTHRTEATVWQPRWLVHPNGAIGLVDLVITTSNVAETANRFSLFLNRQVTKSKFGSVVALDRGRVQIVAPDMLAELAPGLAFPSLPFLGFYAIAVKSSDALELYLQSSGVDYARRGDSIVVRFPGELGIGAWMFVEEPRNLPWRE
jgi:Glyoxalase-like domain